ncbi:1700029I15Rik [Phodopus roborovskii]|uniref:1700029I15Rik protein n=1 Tax=Phodopus roborovskii TaxID=109678 RepID=A0AAU9Z816_PHORO|nr:1700029I15Rik [Phodopus roborovskii]
MVLAMLGALYPRAGLSLFLLYLILAGALLRPQPQSTEDIVALVIRNLDGTQELHPELINPVAVFGKGWKATIQ